MRNSLAHLVIVSIIVSAFGSVIQGSTIPFPDRPSFLIPLLIQKQPGAAGSLWSSELTIYNSGETTAQVWEWCAFSGCGFFLIPAKGVRRYVANAGAPFPGMFISVENEAQARNLVFFLRVFDESRTESSWGTYVPIVYWNELKARTLIFPSVPIGSSFRHTLRIYSEFNGGNAVIRYFREDSGELIFQTTQSLEYGYIQHSSNSVPLSISESRLRIEVRHEDGRILWALVSVTSLETHAVTIIPAGPEQVIGGS